MPETSTGTTLVTMTAPPVLAAAAFDSTPPAPVDLGRAVNDQAPVMVSAAATRARMAPSVICASATAQVAGSVAGKRALGTVPLARLLALRFVRFAPEIAGSVAGKRAFGMIPLSSWAA